MFFPSLRLALRRLVRRPGTTAVHVGGLAVGLACCFLALLYVADEQSYDRFHEDAERIVTVQQEMHFGDQTMRLHVAGEKTVEALRTGTSGVVAVATTMAETGLVRRPDQPEGLPVENLRFADASFFDVFTFPLEAGNPKTVLSAPNQAVLTEDLAQTLFGTANVVGEQVSVERTGFGLTDPDPIELTITGVAETPPVASTLPFEMLISGTTPLATFDGPAPALGGGHPTYVRLSSLADTVGAHAAIEAALASGEAEDFGPETTVHLPLLVDQHFDGYSQGMAGKPMYLLLFSAVAALILLLACINYANLATALATQRATEVGVRKALGAGQSQLSVQFLAEALLLAVAAGAVALTLTALVLPSFNGFFGKGVSLAAVPLPMALAMAGVIALAGLLAGTYPALVLARFQPVRALSGLGSSGRSGTFVRRGLVVFQFAVTCVLLGGTLLVAGQLSSVRSRDLGFQGDQVVVLGLQGEGLGSQRAVLEQAMEGVPGVVRASVASTTPGGPRMSITGSAGADESEDDFPLEYVQADADFQAALGLRMAAGAWYADDDVDAVIYNEAAARKMGLMTTDPSEAVGQTVGEREVVGVVRDFHFAGLRAEIKPTMFVPVDTFMNTTRLAVQIDAEQAGSALSAMRRAWERTVPEYPFEPEFVKDQFAEQLREDRELGQLFGVFAGIAVVLACMGVFGLAAHEAERRTKEIGIRKVLGATVAGLVARLSGEFVRLVVIALVIAVPITVLLARRWLEDFAYPAPLAAGPFVLVAVGVLVLALLAAGVHAVRAATADPIRALRSD